MQSISRDVPRRKDCRSRESASRRRRVVNESSFNHGIRPRRTHRRVTKALRRRFFLGTRRKRRRQEEEKKLFIKVEERVSAARNPSTRRAVFFTPIVGDWFHARGSAPGKFNRRRTRRFGVFRFRHVRVRPAVPKTSDDSRFDWFRQSRRGIVGERFENVGFLARGRRRRSVRPSADEGVRRTRQSNSRLERFHGSHHATHGSFVIQRIPTAADVCESLESFSRFRRYRASHRSEFQSFRAIVSVRFSQSDERPVAGNAIGRKTVVVERKERESSMGEVEKISRGVRRERLGSFRRVS